MLDAERFRLRFGPYRSPRCRVGRTWLPCAIHGRVKVLGISDSPIPWPMAKPVKGWARIICGDLVRALRKESCIAVAHAWGVSSQTVTVWRRALNVPRLTAGTRKLLSAWSPETVQADKARRRAKAAASDPERVAKIANAKRGKRRPRHVIEALRRANIGRPLSEEHRANLSAAARRRGARPPAAGRSWTAKELRLMGTMLDRELADRFGRSPQAVALKRKNIGITAFRLRS